MKLYKTSTKGLNEKCNIICADSIDSVYHRLKSSKVDLVLLSSRQVSIEIIEELLDYMIVLCPWVPLVMDGIQKDHIHSRIWFRMPVRGVVDVERQSENMFMKSILKILRGEPDFSALIEHHQSLADEVDVYVRSLPPIDANAQKLILMFSAGIGLEQIAQELNITRKTVNARLEKYCNQLNINGFRGLAYHAGKNRWFDEESMEAIAKRLIRS